MLQKRLIFNIINKAMPHSTAASSNNNSNSNGSGVVVDHLSTLFHTISTMCRDMFVLIRQVAKNTNIVVVGYFC